MKYLCDPARNDTCKDRKKLCFINGGPCGLTDDVRCAVLDLWGNPVKAQDPNAIEVERWS